MSSAQAVVGDVALRHLDAAYNLGRWLLGNEHDAADAVHDAFVRATRSAGTYAGGNARAWWLTIVRNCCLARIAKRSDERRDVAIDQVAAVSGADAASAYVGSETGDVEERIDVAQRRALVTRQLEKLPAEFREVLILREIEELSYREIADVLQTPIGTVMSRLARGRALLRKALDLARTTEVTHGL